MEATIRIEFNYYLLLLYVNINTWYVAERLSQSLLKLFRERTREREEQAFFNKHISTKKKQDTSLIQNEDSSPPAKKRKTNTKPEEFIIEQIRKFDYRDGKELFYVKWKGYLDSDNTWEPIEHLDNCPLVLAAFVSNLEEMYCDQLNKLKKELGFDSLLSDENLTQHLEDIDSFDMLAMKQQLILKFVAMIRLNREEECYAAQLVLDTRDLFQKYTFLRKRCRQLIDLRKWEEHINQVDKSKRLEVENIADLAGPPENFTYINQSIPGAGVTIPDDPPIGCECTACNCRAKACCGMQAGLYAYTLNKRLRVAPGTPIYECNKACKCSSECSNRVVQGGRSVKLCIYRTHNGCGWGVRTEQKIRQGQFICQYVGEVITFEEAEKRGREYDANGLTYLFDLDFNSVENPYTVDAAHLGNVSHFINHSCDPNLGVWAVWADCLDPNLPMLALFATKDIEAGQEICFDYLQKASDVEEPSSSSNVSTSSEVRGADGADEASIPLGTETHMSTDPMGSPAVGSRPRKQVAHRNHTECKCGAVNCRKYLF